MPRRDDPQPPPGDRQTLSGGDRHTLLLSVDFEDWHQLVRRRLGIEGWERPGPALRRQTERLLALLDELGIRATFFVLGMAARSHSELVRELASSGHEIGCHGDAHRLVGTQTRQEFATDLDRAQDTIEELTGRRAVGYRAPAFSITRDSSWAYEVLAERGFAYDASQHDTPRNRDRAVSATNAPHPIEFAGEGLWEFPVAVWRRQPMTIPVGGASYWAVLPTRVVLNGLQEAGAFAGLYLHPYELDSQPLRPGLPRSSTAAQRAHGLVRTAHRNLARSRAAQVLRAIAERHRLIPYGEAYARLSGSAAAGP